MKKERLNFEGTSSFVKFGTVICLTVKNDGLMTSTMTHDYCNATANYY